MVWFGDKYRFAKGQQAQTVRVLWEAWEEGTPTLGQETIGERVGSDALFFSLSHVFRIRRTKEVKGKKKKVHIRHPAWGTMIVSAGKGIYRLAEP